MKSVLDIATDLARQFEGCAEKQADGTVKAYWDDHGKAWTIGYGCTGRDINQDTIWTMERCDAELRSRINRAHDSALHISPVLSTESIQRQAAITDFIYNLGAGTYIHSTLRRMVDLQKWDEVRHEIVRFTHAGGKVLAGLVARREAEEDLI